eukprot:gene5781-11065_t
MPTAQGSVSNPSDKEDGTCQVRMLFDSCSQRSYLSKSVKKSLNLLPIGKETILINTFGNEGQILEAELVQLVVHCFNGERVVITAYCVDHVCEPIINQNIAFAYGKYEHLSRLPLADQSDNNDSLEIQLLIGLDHYWSLIDGQVTRGEMGDGPIAMKSKLGYVLSGPVDMPPSYANDHRFSTHLTESHILKAECLVVNSDSEVNEQIHKFWDYESIGVKSESPAFCDNYMENEIEYNGRRYEAKLPFKPEHVPISDTFLLCKNSSPFVLNATLRKHIMTEGKNDPLFVYNTLRSLYVDDYQSSFSTNNEAFKTYRKLKDSLHKVGFNIRKWVTNNKELKEMIKNNPDSISQHGAVTGELRELYSNIYLEL